MIAAELKHDDYLDERPPPRKAPKGWTPMVELLRGGHYVTPRSVKLRQAIGDLCHQKRQDFQRQGMPEGEAAERVRRQWAGDYARTSTGCVSLHVSPKAVKQLEKNGSLRLRPVQLPEDKKHWIPATVSRGCMAVNLDTKLYCRDMLVAACERMLTRHPRRKWSLPADDTGQRPAGKYKTTDVMARYANGTQSPCIHFDRDMAPYIRQELGLPTALPRNRRHWIPVTSEGCSRIGVERLKQHTVALRRICARLLAEGGPGWWLPYDKNRSEPSGWYLPASVIGIYTRIGKPPVYNFDPRLTQEGIITKQMVKAEAATLTAKDFAAPDPICWRSGRNSHLRRLGGIRSRNGNACHKSLAIEAGGEV